MSFVPTIKISGFVSVYTYLILSETGFQHCVKMVSPLLVPKSQYSLTHLWSSSSSTTLLMANSLLAATAPAPLFPGTILAGMRTTAPFRWHSSLPLGFSAGGTLLRPLNGSSSSIATANININKLFNALRDNKALSLKMNASLAILFQIHTPFCC